MKVNIDPVALGRLQELLKGNFQTALQTALNNTHAYIMHINDALAANDNESMRFHAHKIVSSAGAFGLTCIVDAARAIEYAQPDNTQTQWIDLRDRLEQAYMDVTLFVLEKDKYDDL